MDPDLARAMKWAAATEPEILWTRLFMLACYAAASVCLYRCIRKGFETSLKCALGQVFVFASFAVMFWFVESWAHHRTGFYLYSTTFSDGIPRIPFGRVVGPGVLNECTQMVATLGGALDAERIPLSIILMEASLTYSAMWTARMLGANLVVQPLLAGLVMLDIDLLLDPVLATVHDCTTGAPLATSGFGLGLWRWYVDPQCTEAAQFFGIPIFNYAAWFAAPLLLVALTNLLGPFSKQWLVPRWRRQVTTGAPSGWQGLTLVVMAAAITCMFMITPDTLSRAQQWTIMGGLVGASLGLTFVRPSRYQFENDYEPSLAFPVIVALLIPTVPFVIEGFFLEEPRLIPVGVLSIAFGLALIHLPYRGVLRSSCERLMDVDRFVRLHYFGFTSMLVLLGAATVRTDPDKGLIGGLVLVAMCFHIHGYVLNDVIDLDLDRRQPLRRRDPLVRGAVSRESALAFSLLQIPLAALITFHMKASLPAWIALGTAFALSIVYDKWGKVLPFPPLADLVQGLAWGSLVLYAALVANPDAHLVEIRERTLPLLGFGVGFILLINGIHGGLRDLWNDLVHGRRTTAIFLGAQPAWEGPDAQVESSRRVILFAFAVHALIFLPSFEFLLRQARHYDPIWYEFAWVGTVGLFVSSSWILWHVVKTLEPNRGWWISRHIFVLLLGALVVYLASNVPSPSSKMVVLFFFLFPLALQASVLERVVAFIDRAQDTSMERDHVLTLPRPRAAPIPEHQPPAPHQAP
jgi:4-hydroxybenzoate polyprenyltransferase